MNPLTLLYAVGAAMLAVGAGFMWRENDRFVSVAMFIAALCCALFAAWWQVGWML